MVPIKRHSHHLMMCILASTTSALKAKLRKLLLCKFIHVGLMIKIRCYYEVSLRNATSKSAPVPIMIWWHQKQMIAPPKTDHVPDEESFCEGLFALQETTFFINILRPRNPWPIHVCASINRAIIGPRDELSTVLIQANPTHFSKPLLGYCQLDP